MEEVWINAVSFQKARERIHSGIEIHSKLVIAQLQHQTKNAIEGISALTERHNRSIAQINRWRRFNELNGRNNHGK